jgi:hypothetical protein
MHGGILKPASFWPERRGCGIWPVRPAPKMPTLRDSDNLRVRVRVRVRIRVRRRRFIR